MGLAYRVRSISAWLVIVLVASPASAPPPPSPIFFPGKELAESESYWLAPYTLYTQLQVGPSRENRVQWFAPDGKLVREIRNVHINGGFVSRSDSAGTTYTSILNPRWEVFHSRREVREDPSGLNMWTGDGRVFVFSSRMTWSYEEWPRVPTTIDMYVEGERSTLGPYLGGPREFHLDSSGALAVQFLDGQLVVIDSKGREKLRSNQFDSPQNRLVGCYDHGFLVGTSNETQPMHYYGFDGARSSFTIPGHFNPLWIGKHRAFFRTALDSLILMDCEKGRAIWKVFQPPASEKLAVAGPYLIQSTLVTSKSCDGAQIVLRALELETGKLAATWESSCSRLGRTLRPQFFEREGRRLFLDGSRLSEIDPDDIREGREGWRTTRPPKPSPPPFEEGPPTSPLSWRPIRSKREAAATPFALRQRILKQEARPASVQLVNLQDKRPYGEARHRRAWLARYDSVLVQADSGRTTFVTISAAFDAKSGNLVCAFTDAAPRWVRTRHQPVDIESWFRMHKQMQVSPAVYSQLQATPAEILGVLWHDFGIEPHTAGQIVMRPRFISSPYPAKRFEGRLIPVNPPANEWIVEVLGRIATEDYPCATYVVQFRDRDLQMLSGQPMP